MDTQMTFTDKEYIGNLDDELATQEVADVPEIFQIAEIDLAEFDLANSWFLS